MCWVGGELGLLIVVGAMLVGSAHFPAITGNDQAATTPVSIASIDRIMISRIHSAVVLRSCYCSS